MVRENNMVCENNMVRYISRQVMFQQQDLSLWSEDNYL